MKLSFDDYWSTAKLERSPKQYAREAWEAALAQQAQPTRDHMAARLHDTFHNEPGGYERRPDYFKPLWLALADAALSA